MMEKIRQIIIITIIIILILLLSNIKLKKAKSQSTKLLSFPEYLPSGHFKICYYSHVKHRPSPVPTSSNALGILQMSVLGSQGV